MIHFNIKTKNFLKLTSAVLCLALLFTPVSLLAAENTPETAAESTGNETTSLAENTIWAQGPSVTAESAILMEANTGTILYAKNIHDAHYPASTTKILTALIAMERCSLDEQVKYSYEAVNSIDWRNDSNIGIKVGETITMEQSLYGLLVGSGNECGNAIGEHISGSVEEFANLMNERSKELGCADSNWVTTNGIHDDDHYTSAYDLAMIGRAFFHNEMLCKMSSSPDYVIPASSTLSQELIPYTKNKLVRNGEYQYEYLVGSKTGYTDIARQNLVSCAQKDGLKLICVVMKDEAPYQYEDTIALFDYGFSNFKAVNVASNDTRYTIEGNSFFQSDSDIFGNSDPILYLDKEDYIVLPSGATIEDAESSLILSDGTGASAATIEYTYKRTPIGSASVLLSGATSGTFSDDLDPSLEAADTDVSKSSVSVKKPLSTAAKTIILVGAVLLLISGAVLGYLGYKNYKKKKRRRAIMKNQRRRKEKEIIDFDRYTRGY